MTMHGGPDAVADVVRRIAGEIASATREIAYLLSQDGAVFLRREGDTDRVGFDDLGNDVFRGKIGVHNHPGGTSLSRQDVRFLLTFKLARLCVVAAEQLYLLDLPDDTEWEDVSLLVESIEQELRSADLLAINLEGADPLERHRTRMHRLWTDIADIRGWNYRREELR